MRTVEMLVDSLHDETRARWAAHSPEEFIKTVMHGALRQKLDMTSIVIHVYAQIVHRFPNAALLVDAPDTTEAPMSLRDLFANMRNTVAEAQTAANADLSQSSLPYSPEWYILHVTNEIRHYIKSIEGWALRIEADSRMETMRLPGAKGRTFEDVALDILKHVSEVMRLLDFAQAYLNRRGAEPAV